MKYADSVTRSFQQYSSPEWRNAYANAVPGKFVDYQDPTYLGFYLKFYGLGPDGTGERPIGDTGNFVPLDEYPGGLFYHEDHPDSAIRYLKNIGEYTRAQMLREFVMGIKKLSEEMPWYFVKVSGLEAVWQIKKGDSFRGKDLKLSFELLESIDLKITYLLDLYRKAAFDTVYMRWMLPPNLRTFEMDLVITEIRTIQRPASVTSNDPNTATDDSVNSFRNRLRNDLSTYTNSATVPGLADGALRNFIAENIPNTQAASTLNSAISAVARDSGEYSSYPILMRNFNELATFLVFNFSHCEFMPWEEAPPYLSSVGKTPDTMATGKMTIMTPIVREFNTYGLLGAVLEDTLFNTSRTKDQADKLFPAGAGGNANSATVPVSELGYLEGIKKESFDNSKQNSNQNTLKENNKNFQNQANSFQTSVLAGGVNDLGRIQLGNVFRRAFEPTVAQDIADKVFLEAPEIIQNVLGEVALSSSGAELEGSPQPTNVEFVSPPQPASTATNVTLVAPIIKNPSVDKVEFESVTQNPASSSNVDLQSPPVGPALSAKVDFGNTGASLTGTTGKTELAGIGSLDGSTGKVELQSGNTAELVGQTGNTPLSGTGSLDGSLTKVDLEAAPISEGGSGSIDLVEPPQNEDAVTRVNLTEAPMTTESPSNVELVAPPVDASTDKNVNLTAPPVADTASSRVDLQGQGSTEGDTANVGLEAPPKTANGALSVDLEAPPTVAGGSGTVDLQEAPKSSQKSTRTELEEPPKATSSSASVDLNEAPQNSAGKGKTELTPPPTVEISPGFVELAEPTISNTNPGKEELVAPKSSDEAPSKKVNLQAPKIGDEELDRVNLEAPPVQTPILGKDILTGNEESLVGKTGTTSLDSPPNTIVDMGSIDLEAPPGSLDVTDIGNADLQAP